MINLTFNNTNVALTPNEDGLYNLNLVHRASGGATKNNPSRWTRSNEEFLRGQIWLPNVRVGKTYQTFGSERVVLAYAEWISPEFHKAVLDVFIAASSGNLTEAEVIAKQYYSSLVREKLRSTNCKLTDSIKENMETFNDRKMPSKFFYAHVFDFISKYASGLTAKEIEDTYKLAPRDWLLAEMNIDGLSRYDAAFTLCKHVADAKLPLSHVKMILLPNLN